MKNGVSRLARLLFVYEWISHDIDDDEMSKQKAKQ